MHLAYDNLENQDTAHEGPPATIHPDTPSRVELHNKLSSNSSNDDPNESTDRQCTETHAYAHTNNDVDVVLSLSTSSSLSSITHSQQQQQRLRRSSEELEKIDVLADSSTDATINVYPRDAVKVNRKIQKRSKPVNEDVTSEDKKPDALRSKTSIDEFFRFHRPICSKCARLKESPVYSDRFVYKKQPLLAKEMSLLQTNSDSVVFRPSASREHVTDFMPIFKLTKSNTSGIFYNIGTAFDLLDLKKSLEPSIILLETTNSLRRMDGNNTPVNHRIFLDKGYSRISEKCAVEPITKDEDDFKVNIDFEIELRNWTEKTVSRRDEVDEHEQNRSSLLMLEPLLLVSSETTNRRQKYETKRLAHSEHLKLVRIVIAYTLTFIILVSITFYVVYFT